MSVTAMSFKMKPLCSAVLMAALLVTVPVQAASDKARIIAETNIKPLVTLTAKESQAVSLAAGRILLHTDNARIAIAAKDKKMALDEIEQGLRLVKVVDKAMPTYKVTTTIKTGDVTYSDEDEVSTRFVPVFNEQFIEDVIAPVVRARKMEKPKDYHGHKHGHSAGKPMAFEDYSVWRKATMKLDIVEAENALTLAKSELEKGHFDNADLALALLQTNGVVFEFDEIELPLMEAADDLKLAQLEISEGKVEQAQATLKRASDNLKKYERITGESRARDVRELQKEIDSLSKSLAKGGHSESSLEKVGKTIASYWERVVKWFK